MNVLGLCRACVLLSVRLPSLGANGMPPKSASCFRFRRLIPIFPLKNDIAGMHRVDKVWDLPGRLARPESVNDLPMGFDPCRPLFQYHVLVGE